MEHEKYCNGDLRRAKETEVDSWLDGTYVDLKKIAGLMWTRVAQERSRWRQLKKINSVEFSISKLLRKLCLTIDLKSIWMVF